VTEHKGACCSSPAAICYWFVASLIAWGVVSLVGLYWRPLRAASAATILFAMGIGCVANWLRNRTLHCVITGPPFLLAALIRAHWNRHCVSTGMALRAAFLIAAVKAANVRSCAGHSPLERGASIHEY
jgi:hypothetical protein